VVLAGIIAFLVWRVADRYNRTKVWLNNLETALGLRVGVLPTTLITDDVKRWEKGHKSHFVWAIMLMLYTVVLGVLSAILLYKSPVRPTPPQTQTFAPPQEQKTVPSRSLQAP
jgi:hypothetical protein